MIYIRHKTFRKYQKELAEDIYKTVQQQKIFLAEAPTGLGKTDASIGAVIEKILSENLTLFFLTPKISQHIIVGEVIKGINKKYGLSLKLVDMVGRRYMCVHPSLINADYDNFYSACEQLRKKEFCYFYNEFYKAIKYKNLEIDASNNKTVYEYGMKNNFCPYEILLHNAKTADIIVADYFHIFSPRVRESFLYKTKKDLSKSIVIIDEAHNLVSRLRNLLSSTLTHSMLEKADKELELLGYEKLKLNKLFKKILKEGEKIEDKFIIYETLKAHFDIEDLLEYLKESGTEFIEKTGRKSYILKTHYFIERFIEGLEDPAAIIITTKEGEKFKIKQKYLDPSKLASILHTTYSSILLSGTLRPLHMYIDLLGLNHNAWAKSYRSPFPENNRIIVIGKGLTTKYSKRDEKEYKKYANIVEKIVNVSPKGILIFFPSYEVMESISKYFSFNYLKQTRKAKPLEISKLIESFKKNPSILLAVQGGSLAEGIDFNNGEVKTVIIIGVALEEMNLETKALIDYYERKFGKGWEYGYIYPAITKALQAAGRAIRKESDKAAIVLLDERFSWKNYKKLINEPITITEKPWEYVEKFFK